MHGAPHALPYHVLGPSSSGQARTDIPHHSSIGTHLTQNALTAC